MRVETGGRLIEKKDFGIADQRGGDRQTLALSAGKLAHPGVGFLGKLQLFHNFAGGAGLAVEAGKQFDGFAHGEFFRKPCFLQRDTQPLPQLARIFLPGMAENCGLPGGGFEQAFQDFDGRGLPRTVRTEQAETFAGGDFEVQAADGFDFPVVGLAQIAALDGGRHGEILA